MIEITVVLDADEILRACEARGHAGAGPAGADVVCAAVSVLLRSFLRVTEARDGVSVRSEAEGPGHIGFHAAWTTPDGKAFLRTAGIFLREGLRSIAEEYPAHCNIIERRHHYGA